MSANEFTFLVAVLLMLYLSIRFGFELLEREVKVFKTELDKNIKHYEEHCAELKKIKQEKLYLEKKLTDLAGLYNVTKDMSFDIRFKEMFDSFGNFMQDNFRFGKFLVLLFKEGGNEKTIEKGYKIDEKEKGFFKEITAPLRNMAAFLAEEKLPLFLKEKKELADFGFSDVPGNVFAMPLILRKKTIAVMVVEDAADEDRDKYLILAPQLALQIERIRLFEQVERLSITDGLTGVFLRRYFFDRLKEELFRAHESKMNLSFIMADLDYFKRCNDSYGHLVGDVVLKEVASAIKLNVREIDFIARYGGEEFCVLLPETNKEGTLVVAERIRKAVEAMTIKAYDESVRITVSMGISSFPGDSNEPEGLIEKADKALYHAKADGRNRVVVAS